MVLIVASCVVGMDYAVRQVYKFFFIKPRIVSSPHREKNEIYHHGIKPMASGLDIIGPYSCQFFSNSLGMKDAENREVSIKKTRPRVLFMGDSFTEGISIAWKDTFVGVISESMEKQGIEVLNGGVVSYCPLLIKLRLKYLLEKVGLEFDRVVISVDTSDVLNELQYREANGKAFEVPYAPFEDKAKEIAKVEELNSWLEGNIENNFVILGAVSRNLRLVWRGREKDIGISDYDQIPKWAWNWPDYQGPYEPYIERGLASARKNMDEISAMLSLRGIKLTVMVYPWPQQLPYLGKTGRAEIFWGDWAREHKSDFISLYPHFAQEGNADEIRKRYYWKNDAHWNEDGQRFAAKTLLQKYPDLIRP